jgi:hypothetical protein
MRGEAKTSDTATRRHRDKATGDLADGPSYAYLSAKQKRICLLVGLFCIVAGLTQQVLLWRLDANGISISGERLPYWDFSNLWAGSLMVLQGHAKDLFDVTAYRANLDAIFAASLPAQEWSYPPSILLIGVPLALLPIGAAYAVWSIGTVAVYHFALRPFRLPTAAHLFVLLSPAIWLNQVFGQNGALTAALLLGGLYLAPRRPVLAGVLFGLLTIKPHLGILVPFCLLASRNWRAILSAAATTGLMIVATGAFFGFDVWVLFWTVTRRIMTIIMEAPYPKAYHTHAATVFVAMRSLGAGLPLAYAAQIVTTLLAIAGAVYLWRPSSALDHRSRVCITGVLAILATPYGYSHDTAPLYLAIAWFLLRERQPNVAFLAALWPFAFFVPAFFYLHVSVGVVAPLAFAIYLFRRHVFTGAHGPVSGPHGGIGVRATASSAPLPR